MYADASSSHEGDLNVNDRLRDGGRRVLAKIPPVTLRRSGARGGEVAQLRRRIRRLEHEMQEARRLNRRLAELTDIVQELLVPIAQRDEDKVNEYIEKYSSSL